MPPEGLAPMAGFRFRHTWVVGVTQAGGRFQLPKPPPAREPGSLCYLREHNSSVPLAV